MTARPTPACPIPACPTPACPIPPPRSIAAAGLRRIVRAGDGPRETREAAPIAPDGDLVRAGAPMVVGA